MVVRTESPKVVASRRQIIQLMLSSGNHNCAVRGSDDAEWTAFQLKRSSRRRQRCPLPGLGRLPPAGPGLPLPGDRRGLPGNTDPVSHGNGQPVHRPGFFALHLLRPLRQACNEVQVNNAISFGYRGPEPKSSPPVTAR
jgi:hypothetical protein